MDGGIEIGNGVYYTRLTGNFDAVFTALAAKEGQGKLVQVVHIDLVAGQYTIVIKEVE